VGAIAPITVVARGNRLPGCGSWRAPTQPRQRGFGFGGALRDRRQLEASDD
jgi:hypothetical protein